MADDELIEVMKKQKSYLEELGTLMEVQKDMIMKKDVFGLEGIVEKLTACSKNIAQSEVQRRKILQNGSIKETVKNSKNPELTQLYNSLSQTLEKVVFQKDTNDMLIKQQVSINNKVLEMMNPDREVKTYNSYGNFKR